jgi:hypothetical protein
VLSGLVLILAAVILHHRSGADPQDMFLTTLASFLETLGITLVALGLLQLTIETRDWRSYFEERIRAIVIEQTYLDSLDKDTLVRLQTNAFKAQYKQAALDREGGFLQYFHTNLHGFIAEPYRENVTVDVIMLECGLDAWTILDNVSYICRKGVESIQAEAIWRPDQDEFLAVESFKLTVRYPASHPLLGEEVVLAEKLFDGIDPNKIGQLAVSLRDYQNVDQLMVRIALKYKVDRERFIVWQMAHPTRNFHITIKYPDKYGIQLQDQVLHPRLVEKTQADGYVRINYDSWMLPETGVAWRVFSRDSTAKLGTTPV